MNATIIDIDVNNTDEFQYPSDTSHTVLKYSIIVIACFGTVGNILSLVVLSRKAFRTTTTSIFLRVLAVFDTLTLWSYLLWDISFYFLPDMTSNIFCKILNYVMALAPHVASYTLLTVTTERLTAVIAPLKVHLIFTHRRALVMNAVVIVTPCLYNAILLYWITIKPNGCGRNELPLPFIIFWTYFDAIIGIIIPAILIMFLNITTIFAYHRSQRMRKVHIRQVNQSEQTTAAENQGLVSSSSEGKDQCSPRAFKKDSGNHLTIMLILVSLFYWMLMLPSAVYFVIGHYHDTQGALFQNIIYILMLSNNALDFILYFVTARKFRRELWKIFIQHHESPNCTYVSKVEETLTYNGKCK